MKSVFSDKFYGKVVFYERFKITLSLCFMRLLRVNDGK